MSVNRNRNIFTSMILLLSVGIGTGQYTNSKDIGSEKKQSFSDFSQPQNAGSTINAPEMDQLPAFAPSGLSLYFSSNRPGGQGAQDIYVSRRSTVTSAWGVPQNLGPLLNTSSNDTVSTISADGLEMFMQSTRPGGMGGADMYVATRTDPNDDFGWTSPVNIGAPINTSSNDYFGNLFIDPENGDGTLYFGSDRPGGLGANDIYQSTRNEDGTFNIPSPLTELNSAGSEERTTISSNGLEMFISSNRLGPTTTQAVFVSTRHKTSASWNPPIYITELNTSGSNAQPALSFDGTVIYFVSNRTGGFGIGDVYSATRVGIRKCADKDD